MPGPLIVLQAHWVLRFAVVTAIFGTIACGRLTQSTAEKAFLQEHPEYVIVSSYTGEGWEGVGYHHFNYRKPGDARMYSVMWSFEQNDDGSWKVTGRTEEEVVESVGSINR